MSTKYFGLIANPTKPETAKLARVIRRRLAKHGWKALLAEPTAAFLGEDKAGVSFRAISERAECVIALGGDGTILKAARSFGRSLRPLASINAGTLGFLSTAAEEELDSFIQALVDGSYTLSLRSVLEATYPANGGKKNVTVTALNEATLTRGRQPKMISVEARVDGELLNRYRGDGLIVATPTGSTAYSLSAGGSLVSPKARVFLVTPICPHTLTDRSLIVSDSSELELIPLGDTTETLLTLDGEGSVAVPIGQPIRLRRADFDVPLVTLPGHNFFRVVQSKLGWSGSAV